MHRYMHNGMFRGMRFGGHFLFTALCVVGFVLLVVFVYKMFKGKNNNPEAFDILAKRLANGEISEEEYKKIYLTLSN